MLKPQFKTTTKSNDGKTGVFILEPLEQGFGHTMGNSLRRCLLNSIEGRAITGVKISGVKHQFSTLDGLKEDIIEFILQLKQVVVKSDLDEPVTLKLSAKGSGTVTAKDIKAPAGVKIVNPSLELAHLANSKSKLECEIYSEVGFGYSLAEDSKSTTFGLIPVDAAFSPVVQVDYKVESARIGRRTDFDRLIITIHTNGSLDPEKAMMQAAKTLVNYFVQIYDPVIVEEPEKEQTESDENLEVLNLTVEELDLPTRIANALRKGGYKTVRDLAEAKKSDVFKVKNLGSKSLQIIKEKLSAKGVEIFSK